MTKNTPTFTVLVTRPGAAGVHLGALINTSGMESILLPTIDFAPLNHLQINLSCLEHLADYQILIFCSPQAVRAAYSLGASYWQKLSATCCIAAVGQGTAHALVEIGLNVTLTPKEEWGSEGLLSLPLLQQVIDKKILIIKGEGGRELLYESLLSRGAKVDILLAYKRQLPTSLPHLAQTITLMKKKQIHAIVCSSMTGVENLLQLLPAPLHAIVKILPMVVISERMKILTQIQGFQEIWVAKNASHDSIIHLLLQIRNKLW